MASEIRVDKINSLSGVGTVTLSPTGIDIAGITTAATLRATTGIVTSLTAGSLTSLGAVSGTTGTFSAAVSGTTGTFTGDVDIADTIVHTGDTNTKIRFPSADTVSIEVAGSEGFKVDANGTTVTTTTDASLFLNTTNSNGSHVRFQTSGTNKTFLGQAAGISGSLGAANDFAIRSAEDIVFSTNDNNTPNFKIDTSGRVMIGSAAYIGGAALAVLGTSSTPNVYGSLAIGKVGANPTSGTTLANIRLNGGSVGTGRGAEINAIADANWSDGSSHPTYLTFSTVASSSTSATERIRVHAGGNVDIKTGNLVIGTAGKGVDFSATGGPNSGSTGTSELLDDYEEGDYIPSFTVGSGTVTLDSSVNTLSYTKIGRQVTIIGQLKVASVSGPSGIFRASLPFTRSDQTEQADRTMGNLMVTNAAINNANEFATYPDGGGDSYLEIISISGTTISRNGGNNMQANTYIYVNYTYFAS